MRKSEALIFRMIRLKEESKGIPSDIQYKIASRFLDRTGEIINPNNDGATSIINLLEILINEFKYAQKESISF